MTHHVWVYPFSPCLYESVFIMSILAKPFSKPLYHNPKQMKRLKREVDTAQIKDVSYFSMFSSVLILSNWVKEDIEFILSNNNKAEMRILLRCSLYSRSSSFCKEDLFQDVSFIHYIFFTFHIVSIIGHSYHFYFQNTSQIKRLSFFVIAISFSSCLLVSS